MNMPVQTKNHSQAATFSTLAGFIARDVCDLAPGRERNQELLGALITDLYHRELPDSLLNHAVGGLDDFDYFFEKIPVDQLTGSLQHLEWFEHAQLQLRRMAVASTPDAASDENLPFELAWLNLHVHSDHIIQVAPTAWNGMRETLITLLTRTGANRQRADLARNLVLLITIDGRVYQSPEMTIVGPSNPSDELKDDDAPVYTVNAIHLHTNHWLEDHDGQPEIENKLN